MTVAAAVTAALLVAPGTHAAMTPIVIAPPYASSDVPPPVVRLCSDPNPLCQDLAAAGFADETTGDMELDVWALNDRTDPLSDGNVRARSTISQLVRITLPAFATDARRLSGVVTLDGSPDLLVAGRSARGVARASVTGRVRCATNPRACRATGGNFTEAKASGNGSQSTGGGGSSFSFPFQVTLPRCGTTSLVTLVVELLGEVRVQSIGEARASAVLTLDKVSYLERC